MTEPLLHERLGSYLKAQEPEGDLALVHDRDFPPRLQSSRDALSSFRWFQCSRGEGTRIFGIRRLVEQQPFLLSVLRARGFHIDSTRYPIRPPASRNVEHYFIAELLGPTEAKVSLCMHVPPQLWYVLDEHRLSRTA